ncbi:MAG: hypothetical protein QM784_40605 [Polyangiaceae bacterium]
MPPSADHDEPPPIADTSLVPKHEDASSPLRLEQLESRVRELEEALARSKAAEAASHSRYRLLFDHLIGAYVVCKMFYDEAGDPVDYVHLEINKAFEDSHWPQGSRG